jgi:TPR repeat protein
MRMMKLFLFSFALLLSFVPGKAQTPSAPPSCEIQALAIEAALGGADAQYNLAVEFHKGDKVPQDFAKSAALWKMAAKGGVVSAYNNLGHLTYYGRGIKQDYAEGIRLWRVAATQGHPESLVHLAYAYSHGKFLKIDYVEAYAWAAAGKQAAIRDTDPEMSKAISEMADDILAKIEPNLTSATLPLAKRRATLYISRYVRK